MNKLDTMLSIAEVYLEEKKSADFQTLWSHVVSEITPIWTKRFPKQDIKKIQDSRISIFHTELITNGTFIKNEKEEWALVKTLTYTEIKKLQDNGKIRNLEVDKD